MQAIGAAVENLLLAATDMGYGTCWLSGPMVARRELERILDVSAAAAGMEALVIGGYRPASPKSRTRKDVEEIISFVE
ncbi:MAG: nitroreductase family protein [Planctomycetota bacterium]|nr:nitroreductase family protein [Planctomycetota bacterium]